MTCECKKVIGALEDKADRLEALSEKYQEALIDIARHESASGRLARKALEDASDE
jgi:hypothetical protein